MIFCERANLAFLEIPKNASKSMKTALEGAFGIDYSYVAADLGWSVEDYVTAYNNGRETYLPAIGPGNLDHLTLPFLEEHLPKTWNRFLELPSLALIREPRSRFFSALLQRLGQFADEKAMRADDPAVKDEAKRVCDWLAQRTIFADQEYIHFTRQTDFVDLRGERKVTRLFPLDRADAAEKWINEQTVQPIKVEHEHARREPKSWAKSIQPAARFIGRNLIPESIKKSIYPVWRNSALFADASQRYDAISLGAEVEGFVQDYYAADFALFQEAQSGV